MNLLLSETFTLIRNTPTLSLEITCDFVANTFSIVDKTAGVGKEEHLGPYAADLHIDWRPKMDPNKNMGAKLTFVTADAAKPFDSAYKGLAQTGIDVQRMIDSHAFKITCQTNEVLDQPVACPFVVWDSLNLTGGISSPASSIGPKVILFPKPTTGPADDQEVHRPHLANRPRRPARKGR